MRLPRIPYRSISAILLFAGIAEPVERTPATPDFRVVPQIGLRQGLWQSYLQEGMWAKFTAAIVEGPQGNMWFAWFGENFVGLGRYDGRGFGLFSSAIDSIRGTTDLFSGSVTDSKGNLWFSSEIPGTVTRYTGQLFETFTSEDGVPPLSLIPKIEDSEGNVWFASKDGIGVCRYDGDKFRSYAVDGLSSGTVRTIAEDSEGNLWLGTDAGVRRYASNHFSAQPCQGSIALREVNDILEDRTGEMWFVSTEGLIRYDGRSCHSFTAAQALMGDSISLA